ncbi:AraC family transcriptional regulator [Actinoallomurus oryzae]|uniref:AraC family transcriptional regulator n=1 Tax=Actinoallomurus oryzae TaxID=502180 RepID=A0ABP8R8P1_9ACTN
MEHLVRRAVETIYKRHGEPLSLDELAQHAMVSKFHFLRMFSRVTGVTPGRFLSAVRLQEAKRLLLTTSLNVANISAEVGYSSTGTFTRRFTRSVGVSPTEYRRLHQGGWSVPPARALDRLCGAAQHEGTVVGHATAEGDLRSKFYIGLSESIILQGPAVASQIIDGQGAFVLSGVPAGTWYLHAVAYGTPDPAAPYAARASEPPMLWDAVGPITVGPGASPYVELRARALDWSRPPILLALPGLDPLVNAA